MRANRLRAAAVSVGALLVFMADATVQPTQAQQSAIRSSCRNDFMTVCSGVQPGGSAAMQCLQQNAAKVSPPCQQALAAAGGGGAPAGAAPPGGGAPASSAGGAPMQQQGMPPQGMQKGMQPGMQPGMQQGMPQQGMPQQGGGMGGMTMRDELRLSREACGQDYRTYCQRVEPGGGRAMMCLEANAQSLTPGCQQALMEMKQRMGR